MSGRSRARLADQDRSRWSLLHQLQDATPAASRATVAEFARRYWYPVYLYVRRSGRPSADAVDTVARFFTHVAASAADAAGAPGVRFRDWLLERLAAFLAADPQDAAAGDLAALAPPVAELEARVAADATVGGPPAHAYQRAFAIEVLMRSVERLRAEARDMGHLRMYQVLEPFLGRDPQPEEYERLARTLGARPLAVVLALKRLRQRFRELAHGELVDTLSSPGDVADEQHTLFLAINGED